MCYSSKIIATIVSIAISASVITACTNSKDDISFGNSEQKNNYVTVVSREDGSGTRSAFTELFGIEEKNSDGTKTDKTTIEANITNSTSATMTIIGSDKSAVGYISMGALNTTIKALNIDGAEPTPANVKSGEYKISRPFNVVTKDTLSDVAKDFLSFVMSSDGQRVVEDSGYISGTVSSPYTGEKPKGRIRIGGSSSVSPVMEKLQEEYLEINPNAEIQLQTSDSTTGVANTLDGICDIGMVSRSLKSSEKGIIATTIALDGIAVIVNQSNKLDDISKEQVKNIFTGETLNWSDIG